MPVEVDHGLIAKPLHFFAEVQLDVRQRPGVHVGRPGVAGGNLPVQNDGHVQPVVPQNVQHVFDLLVGFVHAQRLREEVCTDGKPRLRRPREILLRVLVLHQLAAAVAPVA